MSGGGLFDLASGYLVGVNCITKRTGRTEISGFALNADINGTLDLWEEKGNMRLMLSR